MGRKPIASPLDDYYQGRGARPSDVDLGKSKGGTEEEIRKLMAPRAKKINKTNSVNKNT